MSTIDLGSFTVTQQSRFKDDSGRFMAAVHEGCEDAADEMADQGAAFAIVNVAQMFKQRSGRLLASIDSVMSGPYTGEFFADGGIAPHAAPLEKGARSHDIPNSFGWGPEYGFGADNGRAFFHPGNKAYEFMAIAGRQLFTVSAGIVASHLPRG